MPKPKFIDIVGLFDWLFGKSKKQKELEERQRIEETRQRLEQEAERQRKQRLADEEVTRNIKRRKD